MNQDPRTLLAESDMTSRQVLVVIISLWLTALDGFDVLAISFAAPGIARDWGIDRAALGVVLSMELIGMGIGSILIGGLADQLGRRQTILGCVSIMAVGMTMAAFAHGVYDLSVWRVFTGGLAFGQVDANYLSGINGGSLTAGSVSTTRVGYSVGAGVEGKIDQHWSVRGQYLFVDLGTFSTNLGAGPTTTASTSVTGALTPILGPNGPTGFNTQTTTATTTTTSTAAQVRSRLRDNIFKLGFNYQF